jgi:hypothetical protein
VIAERLPLPPRPLLVWFGVFGAPAAWAAQHVAGYALTAAECSPAGTMWDVHVNTWTVAFTATAAAIAVLAWLSSVRAFLSTRGASHDDPPPQGRTHFLAVIGMTVAPLFLAIILMSGAGVLGLEVCEQS